MIECLEVAVTCDLLDLHRAAPDRYPYLLESVSHGSPSAHYDILFAFPEQTLELDELNVLQGAGLELAGSDFLAGFDAWWAQNRVPEDVQTHLPFQGGWFVYLGYNSRRKSNLAWSRSKPATPVHGIIYRPPLPHASRRPSSRIMTPENYF